MEADPNHTPSQEPTPHDPNYKLRVVSGIITILLTLTTVAIITLVSAAQSATSIIFLFGMSLAVIIIVIATLFRYPSELQRGGREGIIGIIVASTIAELIASIVSALLVQWLTG